ncbi:hypothetical protein MUK42_11883 [Musa troglodytarum]|uniref:Uncharacterized protein n=1 Tax=Musa troglodytarum TaxID=320322 RepID=A0A9E7HZT4_9LILI|nr:hypothetical protein MUK42_11883 [Musa troglodytarum]
MSSPAEFYNSLPPVSKAYDTRCLLTTAGWVTNLSSDAAGHSLDSIAAASIHTHLKFQGPNSLC